LDSGEPYGGLVQRNGRWYAMSIMPLADEAGVVYGGLSVRVDVHQQVADVIQLVTQSQVAEYGSLGLLTRSPSGRLQVVAAGEDALFGLQQGAAEDLLNMHLDESSGFVEITPPDGDSHLVVLQSIDNWGWVLYGAGEESLFMAANLRVIIMQMVMMLVGTLLISLLVGSLAARTLRPVRDIMQRMEKLGQGDLTARLPEVPARSRNEVHALYDYLRRTQGNLQQTIGTVRTSVDEINLGADEIAAGNADLSSRTEQQAASLQQTAASMEQ